MDVSVKAPREGATGDEGGFQAFLCFGVDSCSLSLDQVRDLAWEAARAVRVIEGNLEAAEAARERDESDAFEFRRLSGWPA